MIGYWNYTVWLTYFSLISASFGIGFAASNRPMEAVICLLLSGFFDLFDGKVARTKKNRTDMEKRYGMNIDSLCDLVAFGVLPAFIGYSVGITEWYLVIGIAFYCLCGLIRLSYFNVLEEERFYNNDTSPNKGFIGMPITMASIIFPIVCIFMNDKNGVRYEWFKYLYLGVLILTGFLFITKIKYKKPGLKGVIALMVVGTALFTLLVLKLVHVF